VSTATVARTEIGSAVTKAGWRILPLIATGYLISFVDRFNVGFAATQMNADLGFSATVYGLGGGLFFLSYALFEVPSNLLLLRFGARRWLARIMVTWGVISAAMMFVHSAQSFYVLRLLLGAAEAGFFPGVMYYFSTWFPRDHRGRAVGIFNLAGPLGSAVMGQVSVWLLSMDGSAGLRGWQWLYLVEGLPAVAIGFLIFAFLPETPKKAAWLTRAERQGLVAALDEEHRGAEAVSRQSILSVIRNPAVLLMTAMFLFTVGSSSTFALSAPLILKELTGWGVPRIGTLVSIGGLVSAAAVLLTGWLIDLRRERFTTLMAGLCLEGVGYALIPLAQSPEMVVAGYLLIRLGAGIHAVAQVTIWSDVLKARELAIGAAAINTITQLGAFAGPYAFGVARDTTGSYVPGLFAFPVLMAAAMVVCVVLWHFTRRPAVAAT